jgi:hypothetical protein
MKCRWILAALVAAGAIAAALHAASPEEAQEPQAQQPQEQAPFDGGWVVVEEGPWFDGFVPPAPPVPFVVPMPFAAPMPLTPPFAPPHFAPTPTVESWGSQFGPGKSEETVRSGKDAQGNPFLTRVWTWMSEAKPEDGKPGAGCAPAGHATKVESRASSRGGSYSYSVSESYSISQ